MKISRFYFPAYFLQRKVTFDYKIYTDDKNAKYSDLGKMGILSDFSHAQ